MRVSNFIVRCLRTICLLLAVVGLEACDSVIYDGEGDCSYRYGVRFVYDRNMKFADAFPVEVKAVTLYAFDEEGRFVASFSEQGGALEQAGYVLPVDLKPGTYDLLAWCTWKKSDEVETLPFTVPTPVTGVTPLTEMTATLQRERPAADTEADGYALVSKDINPLFHGCRQRVTLTDEPGDHIVTLPLVKNTNRISVVLQQLSGEPVEAEDFRFSITGGNGKMDFDNSLLPDEPLRYDAWHVSRGSAEMETAGGTVSIQTAVAELTLARLVKEDKPRLTVTNGRGETVVSIPLIDYLLMVKGYYDRKMDDQEYLDRQDTYSLTFFLDKSHKWDEVHILINSWALVLNNGSVGGEEWE